MVIIWIGFIGACIGSFINVVAYRYSASLSIIDFLRKISTTRSCCCYCNKKLKPWMLIPVFSWLLLKGKCHYCKIKISSQYWLIEALCCSLFILIQLQTLSITESILLYICTSIFMVLALIDIEHYLLPNFFILMLFILGLSRCFFDWSLLSLFDALIGATLGYLLLQIPAFIFKYYRGYIGLGFGDIKLVAVLGTWIHYYQLPKLLVIASSSGLGYILINYMFTGRLVNKIPFGPFLLQAAWLCLMFR